MRVVSCCQVLGRRLLLVGLKPLVLLGRLPHKQPLPLAGLLPFNR
jgi:hypothetical protein